MSGRKSLINTLPLPGGLMRKQCLILLSLLIILGASILTIGIPRSASLPLLAVSQDENTSKGVIAWLEARITPGLGRVYADSGTLSRLDTQATSMFAVKTACRLARLDCAHADILLSIHAQAPVISGPSASAAIALSALSLHTGIPLEEGVAITGTLSEDGLIGPVGGVQEKLDAAAEEGIHRVVISTFTNLTNITPPEGVEVIPVSTLREAASAFNPAFNSIWPREKPLNPPSAYRVGMRRVAEAICHEARLYANETNLSRQFHAANLSLREEAYYAAASYCFTALRDGLHARLAQRMNETSLHILLDEGERIAQAARENLSRHEPLLRTSVERVQLASILKERVREMDKALDDARKALEENDTSSFLDMLAIAEARAASIHGWLMLLPYLPDHPRIAETRLREACQEQLEHAREKVSYALLLDPSLREGMQAAESARTSDPAYCAFKAAKTRAEAELVILFSMLPPGVLEDYARVNHDATRSLLSLEAGSVFPIMAYSYYEYAGSLLRENLSSPATIILYDTYATELATLFRDENTLLPSMRLIPRMIGLGMLLASILLIPCLFTRTETYRVKPLKKRKR